jgi:hypothetical protein
LGGRLFLGLEPQRVILNCYFICSDAEEAANVDDDGAYLAVLVEDNVPNAPDAFVLLIINVLAHQIRSSELAGFESLNEDAAVLSLLRLAGWRASLSECEW